MSACRALHLRAAVRRPARPRAVVTRGRNVTYVSPLRLRPPRVHPRSLTLKSGRPVVRRRSCETEEGSATDAADSANLGLFKSDAMTIFWDLDNLRPPEGLELVWAYRLIEAAFEFADIAHVRAYARTGTLDDETIETMQEIGVTFTECPSVAEGADVVLSTDIINFVRNGGKLEGDEDGSNEAAKAVAAAARTGIMVTTRDEGMAEAVQFAAAARGECAGVVVCGEFLAKSIHRPQFAAALAEEGGEGITAGYWRILSHVAGKSSKGPMGKSKLVNAADVVLLWDSKRVFEMPGRDCREEADEDMASAPSGADTTAEDEDAVVGEGDGEEEEKEWEIDEFDTLAVPGNVSAMWMNGAPLPWPLGCPIPGSE